MKLEEEAAAEGSISRPVSAKPEGVDAETGDTTIITSPTKALGKQPKIKLLLSTIFFRIIMIYIYKIV